MKKKMKLASYAAGCINRDCITAAMPFYLVGRGVQERRCSPTEERVFDEAVSNPEESSLKFN